MVQFKAKNMKITFDDNGYFSSIKVFDKEICKGSYPLLTVCKDDALFLPEHLILSDEKLTVKTKCGEVELSYTQSEACVSFEVISVPTDTYAVVFGPFCVNINEIVGETIGVVQGENVAFGVQSLNIKTLEGVPYEYLEKLKEKFFGLDGIEFESYTAKNAAKEINGGSLFHFFCKRRDLFEYRKVNQVKKSFTPPLAENDPDASIEGAKIAFFGCEDKDALQFIGEIEVEHGLPHPMMDGEWLKTSRNAMKAYLITHFDAENFDFIVEKAKVAGLEYVYHEGPQKNWGHFEWRENLGSSDEDIRKLVDRAEEKGVSVGVHTLTNFTTTNDPYVSPIPSDNLQKMCELFLTSDISEEQTEIKFIKNDYFQYPLTLNTIQISSELITYGEYIDEGEYTVVKNCVRGAFGTTACSHKLSEKVYKLWDHPYRIFFPDISLQDKYSERLSQIFNDCNLKQISFDGLEGCSYTGQDDYAPIRFSHLCWNGWKHNVINDASRLHHFTWHMSTRMNWGEPWGEAMRTGQVEGRIRNQAYFRRNLFPRMLGWFLIRLADKKFECSTLEDVEWALSESAGFDSGYGMTIRPDTLKKHGQIDVLLNSMRIWDKLRLSNAFSEEQRQKLKQTETEWHLEEVSETEYNLYPLSITKHYTCSLSEMQPGQTGGSDWNIETPYTGNAAFRLKVDGDGSIKNPMITTPLGNIKFLCEIEDGQYLHFGFDGEAKITDKNYNFIKNVEAQGEFRLSGGGSAISFTCEHEGEPDVIVRFITRGKPDKIKI